MKEILSEREIQRRSKIGEVIGKKYSAELNSVGRWSWLASNTYLKRVLKAKFDSNKNLSYGTIATIIRTSPVNVHDYFSGRKPRPLTDFHIVKLCELLELEIELNISPIDK